MKNIKAKLESVIRILLAIVVVVTNFSYIPNVFASTYKDYEIVEAKKEVGSLSNPGNVKLTKKIDYTNEEGVYKVTVTATGKNQVLTSSQTAKIYTVVVIDESSSMKEFDGIIQKYIRANYGARSFARALLKKFGSTEIAVITYNKDINVERNFKNQNLDLEWFTLPKSGSNMGGAINKATDMILEKKNSNPNAIFNIVLLADGEPNNETVNYKTASNRAKNNGIEIFTIGYGIDDNGERILKSIASKPEYYTDNKAKDIVDSFTDVVTMINPNYPAGTSAVLSDTIADGFEYVEGSATQGATVNGKVVSLTIGNITESGSTLSFKIRAKSNLANGIHNTNDSASVSYKDINNNTKSVVINDSPKVNIEKYNYVVKYLEQGTNKVLHTEKTVNKVSNGKEYTENAVSIDNYDVDSNSKSVTINGKDAEIIFYYSKINNLSYTVKYLEKGTNTKLAEDVIRAEKYDGEECLENAIEIPGYKVDSKTKTITVQRNNDNELIFYYSKKDDLTYKVNYYKNNGTNEELIKSDTFENIVFGRNITPNDINVNKYKPVGYNDGVITTQMPYTIIDGENVIKVVYNIKTDLLYVVEYYKDSDKISDDANETVGGQTFGNPITEGMIEKNKYKPLLGYQDGVITTQMPYTIIDGTNIIKVQYNKRTDMKYTVKYLEKGTENELLESKEVSDRTYMETYEETAKEAPFGYKLVGEEKQNITVDDDNKELVFYYEKKANFGYKVNYLEEGTNTVLADQKVVTNKEYNSEFTETAEAITGYNVVGEATQTIKLDEYNKELTFFYTKKTDLSYIVEYYKDSDKISDDANETVGGQTYGNPITEGMIEKNKYKPLLGYQDGVITTQMPYTIIDGTNIIKVQYNKRTDMKYTVKYLEKGTENELIPAKVVNNATFEEEVTENALEAPFGYKLVGESSKTFTIDADDIVITFSYEKKTDFGYKVNYLEEGTNTVLADQKVVSNKEYNSEFTETAETITGYNVVGEATQTIKLDEYNKELTFFYTKKTNLKYRVEYYYDGIIDSSKTEYYDNGVYGSQITEYIEKLPDGYMFMSDNLPLTIEDTDENVVKVYYETIPQGDIEPPKTGINASNYLSITYIIALLSFVFVNRKQED